MSMRVGAIAVVTLSLAALPLAAQASVFGANLIVNGDAEASLGSTSGENNGPTPGFTTTGSFAVVQYGTPGGFPGGSDPGVAQGGRNFFAGGTPGPSTADQLINLSSGAAVIDLGATTYDLRALLGGFASQADNAVLTISFLDAASLSVGSATLGPVTNVDRDNQTGLLLRTGAGFVPVGTRSVDVFLTLTRLEGDYDDGYADNLSLILTGEAGPGGVPEPASWALMLTGFGGLGAALRARRRKAALAA